MCLKLRSTLSRRGEERHLFRLHGDRAGFDLGQVQNVVDQIQQVRAGAVNILGEFHLLLRQIPGRVVAELLAEDQDAVQRRAQLVRHIGQKFRFVLGCERQLRRFLFERTAGLLDLLVLPFDFCVAFGQLLRLPFKFLVGLRQLLLLGLQFRRELLGLLQQVFRPHRGLNGIEHHTDALRELLQEREVRHREGMQ